MRHQRLDARAEYRQQENQRAQDSITLANKFRELKSLTVDLSWHTPGSVGNSSEIKYTVNLSRAKSVFRFDCPNAECVRGDFDLSDELEQAVATRQEIAAGETECQGWLSKTTIDRIHCHHILRYKLSLGY
jgi:hypothetical protein